MNYNVRIEIERIRGEFVSQVEISGIGRCGRERIVSKDFETMLQDVKKSHDSQVAKVMAFQQGAAPIAPNTHPSEDAARQPAAPKRGANKRKAKKARAVAAPKREAPRQFAAG